MKFDCYIKEVILKNNEFSLETKIFPSLVFNTKYDKADTEAVIDCYNKREIVGINVTFINFVKTLLKIKIL